MQRLVSRRCFSVSRCLSNHTNICFEIPPRGPHSVPQPQAPSSAHSHPTNPLYALLLLIIQRKKNARILHTVIDKLSKAGFFLDRLPINQPRVEQKGTSIWLSGFFPAIKVCLLCVLRRQQGSPGSSEQSRGVIRCPLVRAEAPASVLKRSRP